MKKISTEKLEELRSKLAILEGIGEILEEEQFSYLVPAGVIRRFNSYVEQIHNITNDDEFINFGATSRTNVANDQLVDGTDLRFKIKQFFKYVTVTYDLSGNEEKGRLIPNPDFMFIKNEQIKKIFDNDYKELSKSYIEQNWKCVLILSGELIEAILLDQLLFREPDARQSTKVPDETNITKWCLSDLLNVAEDLDIIGSTHEKLSDAVRDYRNLVHPGKQISSVLKVEPQEGKIAFEILNILIRDLS